MLPDVLRARTRFFFQAEDGIRDTSVTGVQTCALPICHGTAASAQLRLELRLRQLADGRPEIGRASCRERVEIPGVAVNMNTKETDNQVSNQTELENPRPQPSGDGYQTAP